MCFSATASFLSGATLGVIGAGGLSRVHKKRELPVALIPVFFGLQQVFEGFVWLYPEKIVFSYLFLFFAFLWWPFYVPFAVSRFEGFSWKGIYGFLGLLGFCVSAYLLFFMTKHPLVVSTVAHHVVYGIDLPFYKELIFAYLFAVLGSFFFAKTRIIRIFGLTLAVSAFLTYVFYAFAFTSVWCFFAAALSLILFTHLYKQKTLVKIR